MTGSHPGGPGDGPPDILASGSRRGDRRRPADVAAARRRVAAIAAVAVVVFAGWTGRYYVTGGWRYWVEHRSPLTPGLLCPTRPGRAMPGPGLLAAIADLGRGIPPGAVALQYGCEPASSIVDPQTTPGPLPSAAAGHHDQLTFDCGPACSGQLTCWRERADSNMMIPYAMLRKWRVTSAARSIRAAGGAT